MVVVYYMSIHIVYYSLIEKIQKLSIFVWIVQNCFFEKYKTCNIASSTESTPSNHHLYPLTSIPE